MIAILCSGQGCQRPGMFDVVANEESAAAVFEAARLTLCRDPRELTADGSSDLHSNRYAQLLCGLHAAAWWAALAPGLEGRARIVAGYSVGEVAAWMVAGAMTPATLFELLAERASLMDRATPRPSGMVAVNGLGPAAIRDLCRETGSFVAIRNARDRVVLGGSRAAIDRARRVAVDAGAIQVTDLPVDVASHTPLLHEAAEAFAAAILPRSDVRRPVDALLSSIDAEPVRSRAGGLAKLARQIETTVEWSLCMRSLREAGATAVLELGPGRALASMMGATLDPGQCRSVNEFRSVDGVIRWIAAR